MRTMLLTESVDSDAQHRASIFDRGKTNCIPIYFVGRGLKAESRRSLASVYFLQETSWIDNKRLRLLSIQPLNA